MMNAHSSPTNGYSYNINNITSTMRMINKKQGVEEFARYPIGSNIVVQKQYEIPSPNLMFGCKQDKLKETYFKLLPFYESLGVNQSQFITNLENNVRFLQTVVLGTSSSVAEDTATASLRNKYNCLIKDFQIIIDSRGNTYNIDYDRCFLYDGNARLSNLVSARCRPQVTSSCCPFHRERWHIPNDSISSLPQQS